MKRLFLLIALLVTPCMVGVDNQKADLIVFSYDRPMQLYSFLESVELYVDGVGEVKALVRATDSRYKESYDRVRERFPGVEFLWQGDQPKTDFKPLLLKAVYESPSSYVIFGVDDIIVKDFVDLAECIDLMEEHDALGFYLRLGKHLTRCYSLRCSQSLPTFFLENENVVAWNFAQGRCDWGYPYSVDMTVFRKDDLRNSLFNGRYAAPNTLEAGLPHRNPTKKRGVCYVDSKIVNVPLNRVQNECLNNHMNFLSSQELLELFEVGKKIDIRPLFQFKNESAHMAIEPQFIER